ncbi:acyl-CoA Delta(11) desaturase-like [Photinus pyralis]|uniref:acyl-CoA Delta(11) desaturase-like n=1 Tax=Photinus pyralis TaxID=7054 RepID=UPI00126760D5|nr:acyl-CoA Delta(11) desaturase-like [Photinus pyralis]XP_031334531.1 acyl-CoA Delta(11) desaturase-like [Photinus pyralis]
MISSTMLSPSMQEKEGKPTPQYGETVKASGKENKVVWRNVILFTLLHISGLYGLYLCFFLRSWYTFFWATLIGLISGQGITAGAHRLWAHRTYKARLMLRITLMIAQTLALQTYIYEWVRDHRAHHKFTETDADPHNSNRGFFFSHIGWLMVKRHSEVKRKGKTIDMSDLEADPVVRFQRKYYIILVTVLCLFIPTFVPWYFWNEDIWVSWFTTTMFRLCVSLHITFMINSVAHIWGTKPYDKTSGAVENVPLAFLAHGEGWHNYHHVFPWDYKTGELGGYRLNTTTMLIDFFAKIGWAYDLKTVSIETIEKRAQRTGDGSRIAVTKCAVDNVDNHHTNVWGWGDTDMKEQDIDDVKYHNQLKED